MDLSRLGFVFVFDSVENHIYIQNYSEWKINNEIIEYKEVFFRKIRIKANTNKIMIMCVTYDYLTTLSSCIYIVKTM